MQRGALRLFVERGYGAVSVEEIAAELGVGRTTIFRYFGNKAGLVWRDFELSFDIVEEHLRNSPPETPLLQEITEALIAGNQFSDDDRELLGLRYAVISATPELEPERSQSVSRFATTIAGFLRSRSDFTLNPVLPDALGYALATTMGNVQRRWASAEPGTSYEAMLREALEMVTAPFALMMQEQDGLPAAPPSGAPTGQ